MYYFYIFESKAYHKFCRHFLNIFEFNLTLNTIL